MINRDARNNRIISVSTTPDFSRREYKVHSFINPRNKNKNKYELFSNKKKRRSQSYNLVMHNTGDNSLDNESSKDDLYNQYQEFSEYFNELDRQEIKSCEESLKRNRIEIVYQYISFINKKGRRPMITSNDEDEIKLVYSYYRIKELLDEREIRKMKQCESKLTRYQESKRLYLEMLEERGKGKR